MWKLMVLMCLLGAGTFMSGCVDVKADASGLFGGSEAKDASAPPPDPASDPRGTGDLQRENAQLRQTLARLENDRERWQATIDRQMADAVEGIVVSDLGVVTAAIDSGLADLFPELAEEERQ